MNTSDIALIANIGEIIAAVLVVVSLAYVALQIRQNTHALKVTAAQTYVGMYSTITSDLTKPDVAALWHKGLQDFDQLTGGEVVQYSAIAGQVTRVHESAYWQWRQGALEQQLWLAIQQALTDTLASRGYQQWWKFRRNWYSKDFRQLADELTNSDDAQPPYPGIRITKD